MLDGLENTQKNVEYQILWHRSKNACSWKETSSVSPESQHSTAPGHQKDSSEGEWKKVTSVKTFHLGHSKMPTSLADLGVYLNQRALQFSYSQHRVNNSGTVVMVNFMCQLTGLRDVQMAGKQDFWVWQWDYFQKTLAFELVNWIKQCRCFILLISWRPEQNKQVEEWWILILFLSWNICLSCSWTSNIGTPGSWAFRLQGLTPNLQPPPLFPSTQAFGLNYTTGFPGALACRWYTLGLLSLHNCMNQFP